MGQDFYLDKSTLSASMVYSYGGNPPSPSVSIFYLTPYFDPTNMQLNDYNVGDEFESVYYAYGYSPQSCNYLLITGKVATPDSVTISYNVIYSNYIDYLYSYVGTTTSGVQTFYNTYTWNTNLMPEQGIGTSYYFFPDDGSHCFNSPVFMTAENDNILQKKQYAYKIGFGQTYYSYQTSDPISDEEDLVYSKKNGNPCGGKIPITATRVTGIINPLPNIYPNPANNEIVIKTNKVATYFASISNMIGQTYFTTHKFQQKAIIDISKLPADVYFVKITDENGGSWINKLVITH